VKLKLLQVNNSCQYQNLNTPAMFAAVGHFRLSIACKNIEEMIDFVTVINSDFWVTDATNNRMINVIWCCFGSGGWTVTGLLSSSSSWLGLCRLLWRLGLVSENLVHAYRTVHDKHCSVLVLVSLMSETQTHNQHSQTLTVMTIDYSQTFKCHLKSHHCLTITQLSSLWTYLQKHLLTSDCTVWHTSQATHQTHLM